MWAFHHAHVGHPVGLRRVLHELAVRALERVPLRQQFSNRHAAARRDCSIRAAAQRHRPAGHVQLPDRPGVRRHRQRPVLHLDLDVRRDRALTLDRQVAREFGVADVDRRHTAALDRALADRMPVQIQHDLAAVRAIADPRARGHLLSGVAGNDIGHLAVPQQRHRIHFAVFRAAHSPQRAAQLHVIRRALAVRHFGRQLRLADAAGVRLFVHLLVPVQTRHAALRAHAVLPVCAVVVIARLAAVAPRPVRVAASVSRPRVHVRYDGVVTRRPVVTIGNRDQRRPFGIIVAPVRQLVIVFQQLTQVVIARALACVDGDGLRRLARPSGQRTALLQSAPQLRGVLHRQAAGQMHHRFELQHAALGQHAGLLVAAVKVHVIAALSRQLALEHQLTAGDLDSGVGAGGGAGEFLGDGSLTLHGQRAAVDGQRAAVSAVQRLAVHIQRDLRVRVVERHTLGHVLPQLHPLDAAVLGRRVQRALQRAVDVVVAVDDHGLDAAGALAVAFNVMPVRLDSYVFQSRPAGILHDGLDVIDNTERIALGQQVHQRDLGVVGGGAHNFRERAAADGEAAAVIVEPRHAERAAGDDDAAVVFAHEICISDGHIVVDGQRTVDRPVDLIIIITTTNIAAGSDRAAALAFETRHIGVGNVQRTGLKDQLVDNAGLVFTAVLDCQTAGGTFYEDQLIVLLVILILVPAHSKPIRRIHRVPVQIQRERPGDVCVFLAVRHLHVLPQRHRTARQLVGLRDGLRQRTVIRRRVARRHLGGCCHAAGRARFGIPARAVVAGAFIPAIAGVAVDDLMPVRHHGHGYRAVALAGRVCIGHIHSGGVGGHGRPVDSALHERHAAGQAVRQLHAARHSQHVGQCCTFPKGQLAALLQVDGAGHAVNDSGIHRHIAAGDHKAIPFFPGRGRGHAGLRKHAVFHRHRAAAHRQGRVGRAPCVAVQVDGHCAGVYGGGHIVRHIPLQRHRAALGHSLRRRDGRHQIGVLHIAAGGRQLRAAFAGGVVLLVVDVFCIHSISAHAAQLRVVQTVHEGEQPEAVSRRCLIAAHGAGGLVLSAVFVRLPRLIAVLSRHRRAAEIARAGVARGGFAFFGVSDFGVVALGEGETLLCFLFLHGRAGGFDGQVIATADTTHGGQRTRAVLLQIDVQCCFFKAARHFKYIHRQRRAVAEDEVDGRSTDHQTIIDGHIPRHHVPFIAQNIIVGQFRGVRADLPRTALADIHHAVRNDLDRPLHAACFAFALYGQRIAFPIRVVVAVGQQNVCQLV